MRNRVLLSMFVFVFFYACSTKTTVQVARHPSIHFAYNGLSWQENNYSFLQPAKIVAYPADPSLPGKYYQRFAMQAYGQDSKGNNLQLNITFDASDVTQLVGIYKPAYSENYGLAQVELFNLETNNLSEYALGAGDTTSFFQIARQSSTEMLISGSFEMTLSNTRDTTDKIFITNGLLTDINY